MDFYIGNTDRHWFDFLRTRNPEDVNFWQPGGRLKFHILKTGASFLLRLKVLLTRLKKERGNGLLSRCIFHLHRSNTHILPIYQNSNEKVNRDSYLYIHTVRFNNDRKVFWAENTRHDSGSGILKEHPKDGANPIMKASECLLAPTVKVIFIQPI